VKPVKVVLIGAGSGSFGRGTLADLLSNPELRTAAELTVALVDIDEAALEAMHGFAVKLRDHYGSSARIEATVDRRQALRDADYAITAVSRRRNELWSQDFHIPLAFGFRHPLGECGGPGAAFHTLRSLHLVVPVCRDMEELCPGALLLNFTNPESRVCLGVTRLTRIRTVGLCHGPMTTHQVVARILGRRPEEVEVTVAGINHFHWVTDIVDTVTGESLLAEFDARMAEGDQGLGRLTRFCYDTFGRLPFPSEDHIAEYLPFGYEFTGPDYLRYAAAVEAVNSGDAPTVKERIACVARGEAPLTDDLAAPTSELPVPIIASIETGRARRLISSNVPNAGGAVPNLPHEAIVEVPIKVTGEDVTPLPAGTLPDAVAALCRLQIAIQELLVQAYAEGSRDLLYQALLVEPTVDDSRRAREMMDELLRLQREYLPELR
jgi:alpha-galactosidase